MTMHDSYDPSEERGYPGSITIGGRRFALLVRDDGSAQLRAGRVDGELVGTLFDEPDSDEFWPHYVWAPAGSEEKLGRDREVRNWEAAAVELVRAWDQ